MNNHQRILGQVLSLDAWHEPFSLDQDTYGVFVEASFNEGRLGGDDSELPFTFNLSLRRALLTIQLESPLKIDRFQVARGIPLKQGEHTQVLRAKELARAKIGANVSISPAMMSAALKGELSAEAEVSKEDELKFVQTIPETLVTPRPMAGVGYAWELEPLLSPHLKGQPWDPTDAARLRVFAPSESPIDPTIKIEVTCALEDLFITNLKPKDDSVAQRIKNLANREITEAAAIQHIKKSLAEANLYPGEMDNRFNEILIADILALEAPGHA